VPTRRFWARKSNVALATGLAALVAGLLWYGWQRFPPGFGILGMKSVAAPSYQTEAAAISADGVRVAILHMDPTSGLRAVEVRSVASGQQIANVVVPRGTDRTGSGQFYIRPRLRFCDNGKYLAGYAPTDRLFVYDAGTLQLRSQIYLSTLRFTKDDGIEGTPGAGILVPMVEFDCAQSSSIAVLGFWGDLGVVAIKLIDLETGQEVNDLGGTYRNLNIKGFYHRYLGDGLAISPDGSKVAVKFSQSGSSGVDVVDAKSGQLMKTVELGDNFRVDHKLAFAGESALMIGEPACQPNMTCDPASPPSIRKVRLWDFGNTGAVSLLGWPGNQTYRFFGSSADGKVVFAYSGKERFCRSCNSKAGEVRVDNARFTVWDRAQGKVVALSPSLRVETHTCPWLTFGACESYQQAPELEMSSDGRSILAFWPQGDFPRTKPGSGVGDLEVYTLR